MRRSGTRGPAARGRAPAPGPRGWGRPAPRREGDEGRFERSGLARGRGGGGGRCRPGRGEVGHASFWSGRAPPTGSAPAARAHPSGVGTRRERPDRCFGAVLPGKRRRTVSVSRGRRGARGRPGRGGPRRPVWRGAGGRGPRPGARLKRPAPRLHPRPPAGTGRRGAGVAGGRAGERVEGAAARRRRRRRAGGRRRLGTDAKGPGARRRGAPGLPGPPSRAGPEPPGPPRRSAPRVCRRRWRVGRLTR